MNARDGKVGIRVEKHHHEVATAGQAEIDMRFLPLVKMGDALMWYKYIVKNVARHWRKTATFMPKPISATAAPACTCTSRSEG
jgi:glutamine synthetase